MQCGVLLMAESIRPCAACFYTYAVTVGWRQNKEQEWEKVKEKAKERRKRYARNNKAQAEEIYI